MKINKFWFRKRRGIKSKDMGYGWTPISWEGWLTLAVMILGIIAMFWSLGLFAENAEDPGIELLVFVLLWITLFAFFAKSKSKD